MIINNGNDDNNNNIKDKDHLALCDILKVASENLLSKLDWVTGTKVQDTKTQLTFF